MSASRIRVVPLAATLLAAILLTGCYDLDSLVAGSGPIALRGTSKVLGIPSAAVDVAIPPGVEPGDLMWLGVNNVVIESMLPGWTHETGFGVSCNTGLSLDVYWRAVDGSEAPTLQLPLRNAGPNSVAVVAYSGASAPPVAVDDEVIAVSSSRQRSRCLRSRRRTRTIARSRS